MSRDGYVKVVITLELEVKKSDWDLNYGTGTTDAEVREDVLTYVEGLVSGCYHAEEGTWRNVIRRIRKPRTK